LNHKILKFAVCFALLTLPYISFAQVTTLQLNKNWKFCSEGKTDWNPAFVPGCVHSDLFKNKLIADPYFGNNEKSLQWIDTLSWVYTTAFDVSAEILLKKHLTLVFNGLDTYASVFLNDSCILNADNMFRKWTVNVKPYLKEKNNILKITFSSAQNIGKQLAANNKIKLPGEERVYTRKAQFQYGWDWGPRFVTCGIWKEIELEAWDGVKISDFQLYQTTLDTNIARLNAVITLSNRDTGNYWLVIKNADTRKNYTVSMAKLYSVDHSQMILFNIAKPKLWWPNGMGNSSLYHFTCILLHNNVVVDSSCISYGFRTIELVQEKDTKGQSFYFKVNNIPVFVKGANYIPADHFLQQDSADYLNLINDAVSCNMNMLRVWGGGIYERDYFYKLCDEKGIMVWQDFMFACAMYPGDSVFLENVKNEVAQNVLRLRNHPCIALWCGNNEIDEGWKNWGWQKSLAYSYNDSVTVGNNYKKLFETLIPSVLEKYDRKRSYIASSPMIGWGHKESLLSGDSHYWGVWWGMEPFNVYTEKIPRFASEYGFQGFPDLMTLKTFTAPDSLNLKSLAFRNHQKHSSGFETIETYMKREYSVPKDFSDYAYTSQLLQAYGIQKAIAAQRKAKPYCMGTLYWQFNDSWPAISWSGIDYYERWKALQYFVKRSYAKTVINTEADINGINVSVTTDSIEEFNDSLQMKLIDFNGKVLWRKLQKVRIPEDSSNTIVIPFAEINVKIDSTQNVFTAALRSKPEVHSECYFTVPKNLNLPEAKPAFEIYKNNSKTLLKLRSEKLVKNIYISFEGIDVKLSDNYFDMLPGKEYIVEIHTGLDIENLKNTIFFKNLNTLKK
jgi:beta-mannosidase